MPTVVITGANRGIGLELARQYHVAGWTVHACCRNPDGAAALAALADHATFHIRQLDVADSASALALAATLDGAAVHLLINNAGTMGPKKQSLDDMDYDGWAEAFNINSMGPLRVLQALRPNLRSATADSSAAKAITITSQLGALQLDWPMGYAYCSSKAAVNKVMRLASLQLKDEGIAVGLIHPGWVRTDMGGEQADISAEESAAGIISTIDSIDMGNTGCFLKWTGEPHPW